MSRIVLHYKSKCCRHLGRPRTECEAELSCSEVESINSARRYKDVCESGLTGIFFLKKSTLAGGEWSASSPQPLYRPAKSPLCPLEQLGWPHVCLDSGSGNRKAFTNWCFLWSDPVYSGRRLPAFRRNLMSPFSILKIKGT
jgi:hypothetical protein